MMKRCMHSEIDVKGTFKSCLYYDFSVFVHENVCLLVLYQQHLPQNFYWNNKKDVLKNINIKNKGGYGVDGLC